MILTVIIKGIHLFANAYTLKNYLCEIIVKKHFDEMEVIL